MEGQPIIDVLLATGPIFSVSRVIGKKRTRAAEEWLLERFEETPSVVRTLLKMLVPSILWYLVVLALGLIEILIRVQLERHAPVVFVLSLPVTIWIGYKVTVFELRLLHAQVHKGIETWRSSFLTAPPWPFDWVEGKFRFKRLFVLAQAMPLVIIFHAVVAPSALVALTLLLLPFWLAEQVRRKLIPAEPLYSDILAWAVSVTALALKIAKAI